MVIFGLDRQNVVTELRVPGGPETVTIHLPPDYFSLVPKCAVGSPGSESKMYPKINSFELCEFSPFPWQPGIFFNGDV